MEDYVCINCGAPIGDGQAFCPKCGTPKGGVKKNICSKCGFELQEGQEFCPKCGQKAGLTIYAGVNYPINQFNAGVSQANQKAKKKPIKIIVTIVIVIALAVIAVAGVLIVPKLFVTVEDLCARGDYIEAYEKASGSEKKSVKAESIAAERSAVSVDYLKDPSSFKLRDAYYKETESDDGTPVVFLVLCINATNSYGGNVNAYWLYTWNNDENWVHFCTVDSLTDEEYKSYDDEDDRTEKTINNLGRIIIRDTMSEGIKLSKAAVQRINNLFDEGKLDSVEPVKMK